jgi:predicted acylesterase/phospholipase RssA
MKAFYIMDSKLIDEATIGSDAVIQPDVAAISFTDFQRAEECIEKGVLATQNIIADIKQKLSL